MEVGGLRLMECIHGMLGTGLMVMHLQVSRKRQGIHCFGWHTKIDETDLMNKLWRSV
jgi:hypothetical protein